MVCVRFSVTGLWLASVPNGRFSPTTWETCPRDTGNSSSTYGMIRGESRSAGSVLPMLRSLRAAAWRLTVLA